MANSYGFTMKGPLVLEKVDSLPAWSSSDEGRIVYNNADKELYMGTNTQWEMKESSGYGATNNSFSDNDTLFPGTIYFIDTTSSTMMGILPASPSIGQTVTIVDDAGMFKGHPFYVNGNGNNIMGESSLTLNVRNTIVDLIFNGTEWKTNVGGTISAIGGGTSSTGGVGNVVHVTEDYTASDNDFIFVEADTGAVEVTLPNAGIADGTAVSVYDQRGSFGEEPCIINGNGNNIMGKSTMKIKSNYARIDFIWDKNDAEWKTVYSTGKPSDSINVMDVSSNYNADVSDFIMADTTAGSFTVTLPVSGYLTDKSKITIMDQVGTFGSYPLNVIPSNGTIDGDDLLVCDIPGLKVDFVWDEDNLKWNIDFGGSVLASSTGSAGGYGTWVEQTVDFNVDVNSKYIVDTTGGLVEATLPLSPSVGQGVVFIDGKSNFGTNNLSVNGNGEDIDGSPSNYIVDTDNTKLELVYYNNGWMVV